MKTRKNIIFGGTLLLGALFLSGCIYTDQPQEKVLRNAEGYNVKSYAERQPPEDPDAAKKLSVGVQGSAPQQEQQPNQNQNQDMQSQAENPENGAKQTPEMKINESKTYSAVIKTSEGEITINLDTKKTPKTVNNFVSLSRDGFYAGTTFHRVIKDFMIQGGDPNGDGSGGPGYKFEDESLEGKYTRGTVAMANSGPNTNGSQFFIIHKDYDLPNKYVIFGHVSKGMETVDKIAEGEVTVNSSMEKSKPVNPVKIDSVEITEK